MLIVTDYLQMLVFIGSGGRNNYLHICMIHFVKLIIFSFQLNVSGNLLLIFVSELKVELTGKFERHFSRQSNTLANQQIGANVKGKMSKLQKLIKR